MLLFVKRNEKYIKNVTERYELNLTKSEKKAMFNAAATYEIENIMSFLKLTIKRG